MPKRGKWILALVSAYVWRALGVCVSLCVYMCVYYISIVDYRGNLYPYTCFISLHFLCIIVRCANGSPRL